MDVRLCLLLSLCLHNIHVVRVTHTIDHLSVVLLRCHLNMYHHMWCRSCHCRCLVAMLVTVCRFPPTKCMICIRSATHTRGCGCGCGYECGYVRYCLLSTVPLLLSMVIGLVMSCDILYTKSCHFMCHETQILKYVIPHISCYVIPNM